MTSRAKTCGRCGGARRVWVKQSGGGMGWEPCRECPNDQEATMPRNTTNPLAPAVDDPAWVLERYREAKEIILDYVRETPAAMAALDDDTRTAIEDFWAATFFDTKDHRDA